MKLYYHPLSTYSQKVVLAFYEKGLEFEGEIVNLFEPADRKRFSEIYAIGKVPLVMDGDYMVPESAIIVEYLENHHSTGTKLIPDDLHEARRTRFADRMHDLYVNESVANLLFQSWKPEADRDLELIDRCRHRLEVCYGHMDEQLAARQWVMGDQFTMADCSLAPALFYAPRVAPFDSRPGIRSYWERMCQRPTWQRVMREAEPFLEMMKAS